MIIKHQPLTLNPKPPSGAGTARFTEAAGTAGAAGGGISSKGIPAFGVKGSRFRPYTLIPRPLKPKGGDTTQGIEPGCVLERQSV